MLEILGTLSSPKLFFLLLPPTILIIVRGEFLRTQVVHFLWVLLVAVYGTFSKDFVILQEYMMLSPHLAYLPYVLGIQVDGIHTSRQATCSSAWR